MPKERACANTPDPSRRTAIAALAASPLVAASVPAHSDTSASADPLVHLYQQWKRAQTDFCREYAVEGRGNCETVEEQAACARMQGKEKEICLSKPKSIEGVEVQLTHFLENFGDDCFGGIPGDLDRRLIENALAGLRELA